MRRPSSRTTQTVTGRSETTEEVGVRRSIRPTCLATLVVGAPTAQDGDPRLARIRRRIVLRGPSVIGAKQATDTSGRASGRVLDLDDGFKQQRRVGAGRRNAETTPEFVAAAALSWLHSSVNLRS
jgi:hypothetical protein